jgi:hypothetical protein
MVTRFYLDFKAPIPDSMFANGKVQTWVARPEPLGHDDAFLLATVVRGEFLVNGLRNRDLCALLYPKPGQDAHEKRRRSAAVTRKLRLLRAHGLIHKVPHAHRYVVSPKGQQSITALLAARQASTKTLTEQVA